MTLFLKTAETSYFVTCTSERNVNFEYRAAKSARALAGALGIAVCSCNPDPFNPLDIVRVNTVVSPAEFRAGDTAVVTVTIVNITGKELVIPRQQCPGWFEVYAGYDLQLLKQFCDGGREPGVTLAVGDSIVRTANLPSFILETTGRLAPGTYIVQGRVWLGKFAFRGEKVRAEILLTEDRANMKRPAM